MKRIHSGGAPQAAPVRRASSKGSKDTLQRCQTVPDVYLAIRYHGRPALQKNPPQPIKSKSTLSKIEKELEEKFESTQLSPRLLLIKQIMGYLFKLIFFPVNFLFYYLPKMIKNAVLPILEKVYHQILVPAYEFLAAKIQPLIFFGQKLITKMQTIKIKAQQNISKIFQKVLNICGPPARKCASYIRHIVQKRISHIQAKIIIRGQILLNFLRNPFKTIKIKIKESLNKSFQRFLHPLQTAKQALKSQKEKIASFLRQIYRRLAGFVKLLASSIYFAYVWSKIFGRYFIKLAKQAFNEHLNELES